MTTWANMTLFICRFMTIPKRLYKLIILINQNDGRRGPACEKPGTKIEFIKRDKKRIKAASRKV